MQLSSRTLLSIITESSLEEQVVEDLRRLGAHGWTITDARGEGTRGTRSSDWEQSGNIRIEVICERSCAEEIQKHLKEKYYSNFAMISFLSNVEVMRSEKF